MDQAAEKYNIIINKTQNEYSKLNAFKLLVEIFKVEYFILKIFGRNNFGPLKNQEKLHFYKSSNNIIITFVVDYQ